MDISTSKYFTLQEIVEEPACHIQSVHEVIKTRHDLDTNQQQCLTHVM